MTFEDRLSAMLHDHLPAPERQITADDIHDYVGATGTVVPSHRSGQMSAMIAATVTTLALAVTISLVTLGKNQSDTKSGSSALNSANTNWSLIGIDGQRYLPVSRSASSPPIEMAIREGNLAAAWGSCGPLNVFGKVHSHGDTIAMRRITLSTSCPTGAAVPVGTRTVFASLEPFTSGIVRWTLSGSILTLYKPGAGYLTFRMSGHLPTPPPAALRTGVTWTAIDVSEMRNGSLQVMPAPRWSLSFDLAGAVVIIPPTNAPAGVIQASFTGQTVDFGTRELTPSPGCESSVNQQIREILVGIRTWRASDGRLTITERTSFGSRSLTLAAGQRASGVAC